MPRITVVNDNEDFLAAMGDVLEMSGHVATTIPGAEATLDGIAATSPELLIIDLRLGDPTVLNDGWALVVGARAHPELRELPIVICTADTAFLENRADEIAALADVHPLAKPFRLDDVDALLEQLLSR